MCYIFAMTQACPQYAQVALNVPLRQLFSYQINQPVHCGMRVLVEFGKRQLIGVVVAVSAHCEIDAAHIKPLLGVLDSSPVLAEDILALAEWAARYYRHPYGEVIFNMLPNLLGRVDDKNTRADLVSYQLVQGVDAADLIKNSKAQQRLYAFLQNAPQYFDVPYLRQFYGHSFHASLKQLLQKGVIATTAYTANHRIAPLKNAEPLQLNSAQQQALAAIQLGQFAAYMLYGVTGSGKTEVYLQLAAQILQDGKQLLLLVPEIGLTPQLLARFSARFNARIALLHSGLSEVQRLSAWQQAKAGELDVIIGTRSALFVPLPHLGAIIVDECHDSSFKQQENWRYNARDLALWRGQFRQVPVVLGSATPALQTLKQVEAGRYRGLYLPARAGSALLPKMGMVDMRRVYAPLAPVLIEKMHAHLQAGNQVLLFLNRRGFAPVMSCPSCGWRARCRHCDAYMTVHQKAHKLRCHHCNHSQNIHLNCPECGYRHLETQGVGTEQLAAFVAQEFADYQIVRVDKDSTQSASALVAAFEKIHNNTAQIVIGTQLLAKGHHFPNVTLVGVIDADRGFFSSDFRASELTAQLIVQVAGRAGRAQNRGEVLIQTTSPEQPLLPILLQQGYLPFSQMLLKERADAHLPPYSHAAMLRAEALDETLALNSLKALLAGVKTTQEVEILGPIPALMPKRQGYYRAQLMLNAQRRTPLYALLDALIHLAAKHKTARKCRLIVDIDPWSWN